MIFSGIRCLHDFNMILLEKIFLRTIFRRGSDITGPQPGQTPFTAPRHLPGSTQN